MPATMGTGDSLAFDELDADYRLVGSVIGRPGQSEVVLRFTPRNINIALTHLCRAPSGEEARVALNGHVLNDTTCSPDDEPGHAWDMGGDMDGDAAVNQAHWAEFGLRPGVESVLRMWITH